MFMELNSGNSINMSHIESIKVEEPPNPDTNQPGKVRITLSSGRSIILVGADEDAIKREVIDAYSLAVNNTLAYVQFEKYSNNILKALADCSTLMTKAGKASEVTQDVMKLLAEESSQLKKRVKDLDKPTVKLSDTVNKLKDIVYDK